MFARTKRLMLRPGWLDDAPALIKAMNDPALARNLSGTPYPYGEAEALTRLTREADPLLPDFLAFSRTHGAPRLVGGCGLIRGEDGRPELEYWIARPYWGLGFATEAAAAVLRIAHATGLTGIGAHQFIDNPASGRVLRKIGFRPTGRVEQRHSLARGKSIPSLIFEEADDEGCMACDHGLIGMVMEEGDRAIAA